MEKIIGNIEFKNVNKSYGEYKALDNISLSIQSGKIYGLVGKSGAGKSTLLRTINLLEKVDDGEILIDGNNIANLTGKDLRLYRKNVGMIFQSFSLLSMATVYDNIALPLVCNKYKKDEIKNIVLNLANIVGLEEHLEKKPNQLSGGQKQRVAIARALALNPKILLCDEATSALDPITTASILELLKKINKELNITIIVVTHQMEVVKSICEEIAIIENGKLIDSGKTEEIFLSNNKALTTLINDEEIIPSTGVNIKLYFGKNSKDAIITKMARNLNIDFSICYGKLEKFQDDVLGSLIINISLEDKEKVINYLELNQSISWEVLQ